MAGFICCLFKAAETPYINSYIVYIHNFDADIFIRTTTEKA